MRYYLLCCGTVIGNTELWPLGGRMRCTCDGGYGHLSHTVKLLRKRPEGEPSSANRMEWHNARKPVHTD